MAENSEKQRLGTCKWSTDSHVWEETCVDWKPLAQPAAAKEKERAMGCTCPETNFMDGKGHDAGCPLAASGEPTREVPQCNGPFGYEEDCPIHGEEIRRARDKEPLAKAEETSVEFDVWWREKGHKYLPDKDEPPQHAYVAERAWEAAIAAAGRASSGGQQGEDVFETNRKLRFALDKARLAAPAAPELSEEQVQLAWAHARWNGPCDIQKFTAELNARLRASQAGPVKPVERKHDSASKFKPPKFVFIENPPETVWCRSCRQHHRMIYVWNGPYLQRARVRCPRQGFFFEVMLRSKEAERQALAAKSAEKEGLTGAGSKMAEGGK